MLCFMQTITSRTPCMQFSYGIRLLSLLKGTAGVNFGFDLQSFTSIRNAFLTSIIIDSLLMIQARLISWNWMHHGRKIRQFAMVSCWGKVAFGPANSLNSSRATFVWPSVMDIGQVLKFFSVFMDRDGVEVHTLGAKEERGQYPAIFTEQAWSIKDLLYGFRRNFSCGTKRVVPSG